jgi:tRNA(Ile)-lysidine synthase
MAWAETHVVVAVSGGADSCALLAALVQLRAAGGGEIVAAHFNHGLRGAAAEADAEFVCDFGERLGVRVVVGRGDVASAAALVGDGLEAAARTARYQFLLEIAQRHGARYVATAHTADDQVETILHRIVRGTGIAGLAGMRAARPMSEAVTLVRPLLALRRSDVLDYLAARGLAHRDDETNAETRFTRNRIRRELLPRLRADYNVDVDAALLRLGQLAGENQSVIAELVEHLLTAAVQLAAEQVVVQSPLLARQPRYLVRELFVEIWRRKNWPQQAMGFVEWEALAEMLFAQCDALPRQRTFPGNIQATKKGEQLALTRL